MPSLENRWKSARASEDDLRRIMMLRIWQRGWLTSIKPIHLEDVTPFVTRIVFSDYSVAEVDVSMAMLIGTVMDPLSPNVGGSVDAYAGGSTRVTPALIIVRYVY